MADTAKSEKTVQLPPVRANAVSSRFLLSMAKRLGGLAALHKVWRNRLTVLAYHRIAEPGRPRDATFQPNISATPEAFAAQMDLLCREFSVVSLQDVLDWLGERRPLPPYPALITFDDGYRDNLEHALPVLQQRGLPAVLFLATGHIDSAKPFYWDHISYGFSVSGMTAADLPLIGRRQWTSAEDRTRVLQEWLRAAKSLSEKHKLEAVDALLALLDVPPPEDVFRGMHLSWSEVRTMISAGVEMGAHTVSHPILARLPLDQAEREIKVSKERIEAETKCPVRAFAYPNGLAGDFTAEHQNLLADLGFDVAFSLINGPTSFSQARENPFAIRRIFIGHGESLNRFEAKCAGIPRLREIG